MSCEVIDIDAIKSYLLLNQYDESGIECFFYNVSDDLGVKMFDSRNERNESYDNQLYVYNKCGLAPKVYDKFDIVMPDGRKSYCYLTERVKILCRTDMPSDAKKKAYHKWQTEIEEVVEELRGIGIVYQDTHSGNFGINKSGQMVVIDFGYGYV